jgi:hypothetical protein
MLLRNRRSNSPRLQPCSGFCGANRGQTDHRYLPRPVPPANARWPRMLRFGQVAEQWAQRDFDVTVFDGDIRHRCTGDLKETVNCNADAHADRFSGLRWCGNPET